MNIQEFNHSELVHAVAIHSKIPFEQLLEWSENELRFELYERETRETNDIISFARFLHFHKLSDDEIQDISYLKHLYNNWKENQE